MEVRTKIILNTQISSRHDLGIIVDPDDPSIAIVGKVSALRIFCRRFCNNCEKKRGFQQFLLEGDENTLYSIRCFLPENPACG